MCSWLRPTQAHTGAILRCTRQIFWTSSRLIIWGERSPAVRRHSSSFSEWLFFFTLSPCNRFVDKHTSRRKEPVIVPRRILWDSLKEITVQSESEWVPRALLLHILPFIFFFSPPSPVGRPSLGLLTVKKKHYSATERENHLLTNTSPGTVISCYFSWFASASRHLSGKQLLHLLAIAAFCWHTTHAT